MKRELLAAAALAAAPGTVLAQAPQVVADMAGTWQLVPVDGRPACTIELTSRKAGGESWTAHPAPACARTAAPVSQVTRWRYEDGAQLLDDQASVRMAFVEDETTLLASPDLAEPAYYLIPAIPGFSRLPRISELAGAWTLGRGKTACPLQLGSSLIGSSGTRRLTPSRTCTGAATRLDHWWLEGVTLLLGGPNDLLLRLQIAADGRFAEGPANGWTVVRSSPSGDRAERRQ